MIQLGSLENKIYHMSTDAVNLETLFTTQL